MIIMQGSPQNWEPPDGGAAVAIGVFDGVHRGHRSVLAALDKSPVATKVALTFGTHPAEVLSETGAPPLLTTLRDRVRLLGEAGADRVAVLDFDADMVELTPDEFVEQVLVGGLDARFVAVGEDFRFGKTAAGDVAMLADLGRKHGFEVTAVAIVNDDDTEIRSTGIRKALAAGEVDRAASLLGRPHVITGVVVPGEGRGVTIGVPTANISFPTQLATPRRGVYAVFAEVDGVVLPAVANLGIRPTFGGEAEVLEVHVIDGSYDLNGKELGVHFIARLRDERRFDGVDALVAQIHDDIEAAEALLGEVRQPS